MSSTKRLSLTGITLMVLSSWTHMAFADVQPASQSAPDVVATRSATTAVSVPSETKVAAEGERRFQFGSKAVSADVLASKRGGDGVINENQLKGVVADNVAKNVSTGMNVISDGAFSGSTGMPMVIQNSGNNVLIQNSTIVNVQLK